MGAAAATAGAAGASGDYGPDGAAGGKRRSNTTASGRLDHATFRERADSGPDTAVRRTGLGAVARAG